jgi:hypothetical protein
MPAVLCHAMLCCSLRLAHTAPQQPAHLTYAEGAHEDAVCGRCSGGRRMRKVPGRTPYAEGAREDATLGGLCARAMLCSGLTREAGSRNHLVDIPPRLA